MALNSAASALPSGKQRVDIAHIDFDDPSGEKIAPVGQNGAGKTTLIKR
jgi:ABC-type multidrug transport system ATPase subunit